MLAISLLLQEMRKKFPLKNRQLSISKEAMGNIKKIQAICNKEYFDQSFYGSAALNRKILLDTRIADLLTPETLIAILSLHTETTLLNRNSNISIWRNSSGYLSLAAVLFYGFNDGLETIELMPNNESQYDIKQYQNQKKKFRENTNKIVEHIKKAASLLEISHESDVFQLKSKEEQSLTQLFQSIEDTIIGIKEHNKGDELLYVPTYAPHAIRKQSLRGFTAICKILKINYKTNLKNEIIIDNSTSLEDFIKQFLSSEGALLNGTVIYLFYDRVHLEACIEQNTKIIFQDKEYSLRDILRKMIKACETDSLVSETAKEQFSIRLKLCDAHLKEKFPSYYNDDADLANIESNEDDKPFGYKHLKKIVSNTEAEIEKSLWSCRNLKSLYIEKEFLQKIIAFYDKSEGTLSLKQCLLLAKWHHPEEYQQVIKKRGVNFFFNVLNEKMSQKPTQGPRFKNNASNDLETLLHLLLSDYKKMDCSYNALNELEISIDGAFFNITQILLHDADFEHVQFTEEQLEQYANFSVKKAWNKPFLVSHYNIPTPKDYKKLDENGEFSHLHYGEKLAITVYTSSFYSKIQNFLRTQGQKEKLQSSSLDTLRHLVPEILLSSAIATHGLSKPINLTRKETNLPGRYYRKELTHQDSDFFKRRNKSITSQAPLFEKGFTSTSFNNNFMSFHANTYTVFHEDQRSNTLGKRIEKLSGYRHEGEVLYAPGTQFQYTDYHKEGDKFFFAVRPIRSIDGIKPNNYSNLMLAKHEIKVIDKMFELYLQKNKHSLFRRFFDTVSNDEKLKCVQDAKHKINIVFDSLQSHENLTGEQLEACKEAINTAIEENKNLVSNAGSIASLGKTGQVLQDALLRINRAFSLISKDKDPVIQQNNQMTNRS